MTSFIKLGKIQHLPHRGAAGYTAVAWKALTLGPAGNKLNEWQIPFFLESVYWTTKLLK